MKKKRVLTPVMITLLVWTVLFIRMVIMSISDVEIWQIPIVYAFGAVVFGSFGLVIHLIISISKNSVESAKKWNDPEERLKRIKDHNHICPRCKGENVEYQLISEPKKIGIFTFLWYILLSLTVLGMLIVIPILLRKNKSANYAVCKDCGYTWKTI